jgi:hypothetical protein
LRFRTHAALWTCLAALAAGCVSAPTYETPRVKRYDFPKGEAFFDEPAPAREYETLGQVRTMVEYSSLNPEMDEAELCRNYFHEALHDLVARARDAGGDAVIGVRSVVMLINGKVETHRTPECADDGQGGQVLAQGIAVRWKDAKRRRRKLRSLRELPPLEAAPAPEESRDDRRSDETPPLSEGASPPSSLPEHRRRPIRPGDPIFVED